MLGGGQLGRMFALEAKRMGYKVVVLDPTEDSPTAQVCDKQIVAAFSDAGAAQQLADMVDVITYEFENVPVDVVRVVEKKTPVMPGPKLLEVAQHRLTEKRFAEGAGIQVAKFTAVTEFAGKGIRASRVQHALDTVGLPAVVKTTRLGYDGKGQWVVRNEEDVVVALRGAQDMGAEELIWEQMVDLQTEISVVATRGQDGTVVTYPIGENEHRDNILYRSVIPAQLSKSVLEEANEIAAKIGEELEVVGTYTVELFVTNDNQVLFNEIAPRPHNSGHWTIEGCVTNQFENQVRAVCGLPLGSTDLRSPAVAMQNVLGDGSGNTLQGVNELLTHSGVYVHLYGKAEAKAGRKMGHITIVGSGLAEVESLADQIDTTIAWE